MDEPVSTGDPRWSSYYIALDDVTSMIDDLSIF